jgi:hypothetical protein
MSKYKEIMDHLEFTPEMEEKILGRLHEEQALIDKEKAAEKTAEAGITAAAAGASLHEVRPVSAEAAETGADSAPKKEAPAAHYHGRAYKIAVGAVAAAVICFMAGHGVYDQYFNIDKNPSSETPEQETEIYNGGSQSEESKNANSNRDKAESSGKTSGSSSSSAKAGSDSSSSGSTPLTQKSSSDNKSTAASDDSSGTSDTQKKAGIKLTQTDKDSNQTKQKTSLSIRSLTTESDALVKVKIISKEGPDEDGFYTLKAEIVNVVRGSIEASEMTVYYDGQDAPLLCKGSYAYFFLNVLGSDEYYITEDSNGVAIVQNGYVLFATDVSSTGYKMKKGMRMKESDFLRYMQTVE